MPLSGTLTLGQVSERMAPGLALSRVPRNGEEERAMHGVLQVKDISSRGVVSDREALDQMELPQRAALRHTANSGDVVLTSRGTQLKVGLVTSATAGAVVTSNLILIRLKPTQLRPEVLVAYLETQLGRVALFERFRSTTQHIALTVAELAHVRVPLLPQGEQKTIADLWLANRESYVSSLRAAELRLTVGNAALAELLT